METQINSTETPEEIIKRLTEELGQSKNREVALKTSYDILQATYDSFKTQAETEIASLSTELSAANKNAASAKLMVKIGKKNYVTAAGRTYNINGKSITSADLIKDKALCEELIEKGSGIFKEAKE